MHCPAGEALGSTVDARSDRWKTITQTRYTWEREALDFVRERLPDHDPCLAWANFEFVAGDGSVNEVDLLVLTPKGFFLVEIKSRPGTVSGDLQSWVWKNPDGVWTSDNPLILANRKAKRLKSLLQRHVANREDLPFLRAVVFLSAEKIDVHLAAEARYDVAIRDRGQASDESAPRSTSSVPGILQLLKAPTADDLARGRRVEIDRVVAKSVARAVHRAAIKSGEQHRRVQDYKLGALLGERCDWQDFLAEHASFTASSVASGSLPGAPRRLQHSDDESGRRPPAREWTPVGLGSVDATMNASPTLAEIAGKAGDKFNKTRLTPTAKELLSSPYERACQS